MAKNYCTKFTHPVAIISAKSQNKENIMTAGWVGTVSYSPPLIHVAIHPNRHTHDLIMESKKFGVSILAEDQVEISTFAGTVSGRNRDKIKSDKFEIFYGEKTNVPLIMNSVSCLECEVVSHITTGDHTTFIGEIINNITDDSKNPLILYDRVYYKMGEFIAKYP